MKKTTGSLFLVLIFLSVLNSGCTSVVISSPISPTISPQISAIEKIRSALELPQLPLNFIKNTGMINSPSGGLKVAIYQDSDGRKYSVNPETNQVVEIDARTLLTNISPGVPTLSQEVLKSKAMKYFEATIPDFEHLQSSWQHEEGGKGPGHDYFFTWYVDITPGSMNRPFAQIGLHTSGLLFAYYNTLLLKK